MDLHFIIVMDGIRGVEMGGSRGEKKDKAREGIWEETAKTKGLFMGSIET